MISEAFFYKDSSSSLFAFRYLKEAETVRVLIAFMQLITLKYGTKLNKEHILYRQGVMEPISYLIKCERVHDCQMESCLLHAVMATHEPHVIC